ncbi:hypothetical protein ACW18Z_05215 [Limosilactobacillus fermentum]
MVPHVGRVLVGRDYRAVVALCGPGRRLVDAGR